MPKPGWYQVNLSDKQLDNLRRIAAARFPAVDVKARGGLSALLNRIVESDAEHLYPRCPTCGEEMRRVKRNLWQCPNCAEC